MDDSSEHPAPSALSTFHALHDTLAADETVSPTSTPGPGTKGATEARYRSVGMLGEGGMGRVSHVYDADLMRDLAIKELVPERRGSPKMLRHFLWEARVTAYLDHPNIVPLHELGLDEAGDPWFSMKLVRGQSLEQALEGLRAEAPEHARPLPLPRRLRYFLQLCQAIAFAHERGVLHRDLKPANIMLGAHGELYVMDWGIAAPLSGPAGATIARAAPEEVCDPVVGGISGTPLYMSPEQACGEPPDVRSDVYTLGVILYELVALRTPCRKRTVPEIILAITEGTLVPITEACPGVSPSLAAVIERALSRQPEDRYPTVHALMEDVELVLDGATPHAEQPALVRRVGRFYRRERHPWLRHATLLDFELMLGWAAMFGGGVGMLSTGGDSVGGMGLIVASFVLWTATLLVMVRRHRRAVD